MTDVLVCVKRVPEMSGQVALSEDAQSIDARRAGSTLSAHDECAVAMGVEVARATGGAATVLTLGSADALEQVRDALAVGCSAAILLEAETDRFGPADVAAAIAAEVEARTGDGADFDLVLVGNDAADTGDFQVGVRLGYALGRPVLTGISTVVVTDGLVVAHGSGPDGGTEVFEVPLPVVVAVREGGVEPRYPSIPGRMKAKRTPVDSRPPKVDPVGTGRLRLKLPPAQPSSVQVLGEGASAAPALVDLFYEIGVVPR